MIRLASHRVFKPVHLSWGIASWSLGVVAGAALCLISSVPSPSLPLAVLSTLVAIGVILRLKVWLLLVMVICGAVLGLYRGSYVQATLAAYDGWLGEMADIQGLVADDTVLSEGGDQRLRLKHIKIDDQALPGEVWVSVHRGGPPLKRGDKVIIRGQLSEGIGVLSASVFRAELIHAERPYPGDVARRIRDILVDGIRQSIAEPEASLGASFLLGLPKALPQYLESELRVLGLTHIVVASGFHLTVVVSVVRRLFESRSKYLSTVMAFMVMGGFLLLTGFGTSMVRASIVSGLSVLAWYYGRVPHPVVLLATAAGVTVLADPMSVWADVGWFLSFTAFAGVVLLAPLVQAYFWGTKDPGIIRQIIVTTTAAQIATFPVIAYAFGQYSPLSLISNMLVLPLVPLAMLLTFVAGLAGLLLPAAASVFGWPAQVLLSYKTSITAWLSASPHATGEINLPLTGVFILYGLMVGIIIFLWLKTKYDYRLRTPI